MTLYYEDAGLRLFHGSNLEVLPTFDDASFDSIVTDPPYELGFMGKKWDLTGIAYDVKLWRECFRVLKPGGYLLAFGGTRTWHRIAAAIEDAGFEIRDSIAWMYGSGFPKSMDVAKAIEKVERGDLVRAKLIHFAEQRGVNGRWLEERGVASAASFGDWTVGGHVPSDRNWDIVKTALEVTPEEEAAFEREILTDARSRIGDGTVYGLGHSGKRVGPAVTEAAQEWEGWGTALKPAFEPIIVARKPLSGTVAANVLAHGTGAFNIDACRVAFASEADRRESTEKNQHAKFGTKPGQNKVYGDYSQTEMKDYDGSKGRFPSNVLLDESQAAALDEQSGVSQSRIGKPRGAASGDGWGMTKTGAEYDDAGGASRFFPTFRYVAKAPGAERPEVDGVAHATVKPLDLMRWLVRLVTRRGGHVLDPFAGSGTTGEAALLEGMEVTLIELEADHLPLILQRVRKPLQPSLFGDIEEAS